MDGFGDSKQTERVHKSLNGLFTGIYLSAILYGLTTYQTVAYIRKAGRDSLFLRFTVLILWLLNTLHAVFGAIGMMNLISQILWSPSFDFVFEKQPWTLVLTYWMMPFTDIFVRGFYCVRIWRLSHNNRILTGVAIISSLGPSAGALYFGIKMIGKSWIEYFNLTSPVYGIIACLFVADLIIAVMVCSLLSSKRSKSEPTRATSVIKTLIGYTLTTGLLTSFTSLVGLILALTFRRTMIYVAVINTLGNIYTNALLASLNRRDRIRSVMDPTMEMISARSQPGIGAKPKEMGPIVFAPSEDTYDNRSMLNKAGAI